MRARAALSSACLALALALAAPPATASGCLSVSGVLQHPTWLFRLSPGLWTDPQPQTLTLSTRGGFSLSTSAATLSLTCVTGAGATTYDGFVRFDTAGATGASFAPEDLASGLGRVDGITVTSDGLLGTTASATAGTYSLRPVLSATADLSYVRAGTTLAHVLRLSDTTFDVDGPGPMLAEHWGGVTISGIAALDENPFWISYDLRDYGRVAFVSLEPSIGVATGQ